MVQRIRSILARFPENEAVVSDLLHQSRQFEALCQEYASTSQELDELAQLPGPAATARVDALQRRRVAVEEEILTIIEGYSPV